LAPHPLREVAGDRPVYSIPYLVFVDDVSGNISKQWNKHWCCYISNACLPREEINKRFNIRFMCTTQHASPLKMLDGIKAEFACVTIDLILLQFITYYCSESFDKMITAWDVQENCEVLLRPYIHAILSDNPMQAQECSSSGLQSAKFCRTCDIGGTNEFKSSDKGYAQLFQVGLSYHFVLLDEFTQTLQVWKVAMRM
jgi:hypothetical protein